MKGDHGLLLKMINVIRDENSPLPDIEQTSEEHRIAQVIIQRGYTGHADYGIINKRNKVSSY